MKRNCFALILFVLVLAVSIFAIACNKDGGDTGATTISETTAAEETAAETTVAATEAQETSAEETTFAETIADDTTVEETTVDLSYPVNNLIKVGKSANGKYDCYDGRYDFAETLGYVTDGAGGKFTSFQEAVDALVEAGSGSGTCVSPDGGDLGICVSLTVPDDGNNYIIYYCYANIDFVFNIGVTFDGGIEEPYEVPGYAYYSNLEVLDVMSGLDGCHILVWSETEGLAPGYYKMVEHDAAEGESRYNYELDGTLEEKWIGLFDGETYFDNLE